MPKSEVRDVFWRAPKVQLQKNISHLIVHPLWEWKNVLIRYFVACVRSKQLDWVGVSVEHKSFFFCSLQNPVTWYPVTIFFNGTSLCKHAHDLKVMQEISNQIMNLFQTLVGREAFSMWWGLGRKVLWKSSRFLFFCCWIEENVRSWRCNVKLTKGRENGAQHNSHNAS